MDLMNQWFAAAAPAPGIVTKIDPAVIFLTDPTIIKLDAKFSPIQSGSGTPSPENVRPISGRTSLSVTIGNTTYNESFGDTYYGGTVDLVSGVLTVTHKLTTFTSSSTVSTTAQVGDGVRTWLRDTSVNFWTDIGNNLTSYMTRSTAADPYTTYIPWSWGVDKNYPDYLICWFPYGSEGITDATNTGVKAYLGNHPLQAVGKLKTAQTVQLSPQTITGLLGKNTVSTTADGTEITYIGY